MMDLILEGIKKAFWLLITFDPEVMGITLLSLQVSGTATLISLLIGISVGSSRCPFQISGKKIVVSLINTGMGLPPVVVGLFVTIFLWRNGPLGFFGILYTPTAMIIAQTVIATPIVMGITLAAIQQLPQKLRLQILALGATRLQMVWILIKEARAPASGCGDGGIWRCHLRGRRFDHGGWQHQRLFPGSDHGDRHGDEPRELRYRHRPGHHPPPCWPISSI